jgi:DNA-binding transcriptional ArsR family regulator
MATGPPPDLDATLRALVDGNRRTILSAVRDRPRSVGEVADSVALSQQTVSHHLRALHRAGLVTEERQGTRHLFMVRVDGLRVVEDFLADFWPDQLTALKAAAERTTATRSKGRGRE